MFLTKENGMRIVEEIKETIGRDVNIMDRTGTILASTCCLLYTSRCV